MNEEIMRYAKIMYEKNFLYGLDGSISYKLDNDNFIINKNLIYNNDINYFTKLQLNKNYKYTYASKDSLYHSYIYSSISQAKVIAVIVSENILKACNLGILNYDNKNIIINSNLILNNKNELISQFNNLNKKYLLIKNFGLLIYDRDFNTLFANIFKLDLITKIYS